MEINGPINLLHIYLRALIIQCTSKRRVKIKKIIKYKNYNKMEKYNDDVDNRLRHWSREALRIFASSKSQALRRFLC